MTRSRQRCTCTVASVITPTSGRGSSRLGPVDDDGIGRIDGAVGADDTQALGDIDVLPYLSLYIPAGVAISRRAWSG